MEKIANWLLTNAGKNFLFYATTTTTCGVIALKYLPNTFLLDEYRKFVQFYRHGFDLPLSEKLVKRFEKALDLTQVANVDRHLYKPFQVVGFDVFSAGSVYSRHGVIVGIPINFTYENVDSIDKSEILVKNESVAWGTPVSQKLLNALVLSEKAQLYAMAREIKMRESPKALLELFYVSFPLIAYYGLSTHINQRFNLYSKPRPLRVAVYGLLGTFIAAYYCFLQDFTQVYFETRTDKELKETDPIFSEGGKEFYTKLMERNAALRALMGREGESKFTAFGNENYLIRQRHVALSDRKAFFEAALSGELKN